MSGVLQICVLGLMTVGIVRADDVPWQPVHWLGRGGVWTSRAAVTVTNGTTNDWQGAMRSLACPVDPSRADLRVVDAEGTPLLYRFEGVRLVLPVSAKAGTMARYYVYWDNPSAWRLGEFLKGTAVDDESAVWSPIEQAAVRRIGDDAPWFVGDWEFRVPLRLADFTDEDRGETLWTVHLPEIVHATPRAQVAVVFGGVRIKACRLGDKLLFSRSLKARCLETGYAYVRAGTVADEVREVRAAGQVIGQFIPSDQRDALVASLTGEDREAYRTLCTGPANLLANASFEDPLVQDGAWTLNPKDCTIAAVTNGFFGARAVRIATETPDAPMRWRGLTQGVRAKPNRTYFFGGFLRTPARGLFLTAHESDAEGRQVIHCPTLSSVASDEWQPVFGTLSADAAAARVQLDITTRSGGVFEADAMLLCESAEPLVGERSYRPGIEGGQGLVAGPVDTMVKVLPETLPEPAPCRFAAARREAESLQIAVRSGTPVSRLQADCPALRHESGFEIPVTVLHVGYVPVDYPSGNYFLDGNLPPWTLKFPNSSVQSHGWSGLWPDPLFVTNVISLASGETQALRFRVKVPAEAPAGLYRGAIVWMADGREALRQPVELEVFGFAIPERPEAVTAFGMDHPDFVKYRTLAEYRASPTRIHASPKWSRDGKTGRLTVDFTDYDREAERYFNEFGFRESYFPREFFLFNWAHPLRKFLGVEPFDGKYPYADCDHRVLKPEYRRTLQEAVRLFWEHVRAKGWADRYTLYIADEPRVSVGYVIDQMKAVCDAVHEVAPEIRIYSSTWTHQPAWDDCLDIMGIGSNGGQFPTSAIAARRRKGKSCRFTTDGKFRIDTPLTNVERSETWYAAAWEVDGLEYWCAEFYTFDPLTHGYHGFHHEGPAPGQMHWIRFPSGDGYVVYPGGIASLRLEAMRDGSEDFSYFQAVRRLDTPEARALLAELQAFVPMPNAGAPTDVARFRELREKAARLLARRDGSQGALFADVWYNHAN